LDEDSLEQVQETKFLGLIIDENLSWDNHVTHVVGRISSGIFALKQMSNFCSLETLKTIYFSMIHSHLSYGIGIYGATSKKNLDKLLLQQKRAIRTMLKLKTTVSVRKEFTELGILTVYGLIILETVNYVKKFANPLLQNSNHSYNTRLNRRVEKHNLEFFKKKTVFLGTKFLHHLPQKFIVEVDEYNFKKKLKNYLLKIPLYSFQEFFDMRLN
jgi:hypothetical protein